MIFYYFGTVFKLQCTVVLSVIMFVITGWTWPTRPSRNSGGNWCWASWTKSKSCYVLSSEYFLVLCDFLFAFLCVSLTLTYKSSGWHGISGPLRSTWSSRSGWTWPFCESWTNISHFKLWNDMIFVSVTVWSVQEARRYFDLSCLGDMLYIWLCLQGPQGPQGVQGEKGPQGEGFPGPKVLFWVYHQRANHKMVMLFQSKLEHAAILCTLVARLTKAKPNIIQFDRLNKWLWSIK